MVFTYFRQRPRPGLSPDAIADCSCQEDVEDGKKTHTIWPPRYTPDEIEAAVAAPLRARIAELEARLASTRA